MKRRAIAAAGAATLGAATAVVALAASTTVGFAETTSSSAYGIAAEGPIPIEPTPYLESTDGSPQASTGGELPDNPLVVAVIGALTAGDDEASVELLRVGLPAKAGLPDELAPLQDALDQVAEGLKPLCDQKLPENPLTDALPDEVKDALDPETLCKSLDDPPRLLELQKVAVACEGDTGSVSIAKIRLLGQEVPIPPLSANTPVIPDNPLLAITANKQVKGDDGSFSVTGLEINLGDGAQVIHIGNATCGVPEDDDEPDDPTATPPAPVTTGLPVTG